MSCLMLFHIENATQLLVPDSRAETWASNSKSERLAVCLKLFDYTYVKSVAINNSLSWSTQSLSLKLFWNYWWFVLWARFHIYVGGETRHWWKVMSLICWFYFSLGHKTAGVCYKAGAGGLWSKCSDHTVCPDPSSHCRVWRTSRMLAVAITHRGRKKPTGRSTTYSNW